GYGRAERDERRRREARRRTAERRETPLHTTIVDPLRARVVRAMRLNRVPPISFPRPRGLHM
ncbi:MAG: hypothetical protein ACRDMA_13580, partial [Solirubrobacterales bacterium]